MIELRLVRGENTADGVFGQLLFPDGTRLVTVEDDWKNNRPGESCIPAGRYLLRRTWFHRGGYETFEVLDVPGRQRILVHIANTEEDVKGCIGPGMSMGNIAVLKDEDTGEEDVVKRGVRNSRKAFDIFMSQLDAVDEAQLLIIWAPGLP